MKKTDKTQTVFSRLAGVFRKKPADDSRSAQIISDDSHMLARESGSRVHFLYVILFGCSIVAALWQHGSPVFTFVMLGSLFPAALLLYIPYRFTDTLIRQLISCAIFFASCFWIVFRIKKNIPFDLAVTEGMILGCFTFLVNCTRKDYHYLFFISLFLLIYSGLIPRTLLLTLIPCAVICMMLISGAERNLVLTDAEKTIVPDDVPKRRNLLRSWHLILLQLIFAVPLFLLIFSVIPLNSTTDEGLFEVSFATERRSVMPSDLRNWLKQDKKSTRDKNGDIKTDGKNPDTADNSGIRINAPGQPAQVDGSGSGSPPGKDLVFTAVMPVKLYHLAMLYDFYDGKKWQATPGLITAKYRALRKKSPVFNFTVSGKYTIKKWFSASLYFPFMLQGFQIQSNEEEEILKTGITYRKIKQNFFSARFPKDTDLPDIPFRYTFNSLMLVPMQNAAVFDNLPQPDNMLSSAAPLLAQQVEKEKQRLEQIRQKELKRQKLLEERRAKAKARAARLAKAKAARLAKAKNKGASRIKIKKTPAKQIKKTASAVKKPVKPLKKAPVKRPKHAAKVRRPKRIPINAAWLESLPPVHYIQLPENLSPKIRQLAESITKNSITPYEKAIALRDHLRSNYRYRLDAKPTPEGRESVEYFLFELKEGHCEYFAAALTVMARSLDIPARVATGFSPGNYNALTREIEVYEYHAHAWSQIFIADIGWLTFDAVPSGNVVSETTPAGIGKLRDPFGEEWRVMPPELTENTLGFIRKKTLEEIKKHDLQVKEEKQLQAKEELQKKTVSVKNRKLNKKAVKPAAKVKDPRTAAERIKYFFRSLRERLSDGVYWLFFTSSARMYAALAGLLLLTAAAFLLRSFNVIKYTYCHIRLCFHLYLAGKQKELDPASALRHFYQAVRLLLTLAGTERKNNQELLAYADEAGKYLLEKYQKKYPENTLLPTPAAESIHAVFSAFYALEYGSIRISSQELTELRQRSGELFELFRKLYPYSIAKMYLLFQ